MSNTVAIYSGSTVTTTSGNWPTGVTASNGTSMIPPYSIPYSSKEMFKKVQENMNDLPLVREIVEMKGGKHISVSLEIQEGKHYSCKVSCYLDNIEAIPAQILDRIVEASITDDKFATFSFGLYNIDLQALYKEVYEEHFNKELEEVLTDGQ